VTADRTLGMMQVSHVEKVNKCMNGMTSSEFELNKKDRYMISLFRARSTQCLNT